MRPNKLLAIIRDVLPEDVVPIVQGLIAEGIRDVEVSLSNPEGGLGCLKKLADYFSSEELYLGAGTVLTESQIEQVLAAGGRYIITPGWNKELVKKALAKGVPVYPGVYTPGEIAEAVELGIEYFKIFPINGASDSYLKALRGPFPAIKLMGVGGITPENLGDYYRLSVHYFGIGSDLVPRGATKEDLPQIQKNAQAFVTALRQVENQDD